MDTHIFSIVLLHGSTVVPSSVTICQKRQRKASWYDPGFNGIRFLSLQGNTMRSGDLQEKLAVNL